MQTKILLADMMEVCPVKQSITHEQQPLAAALAATN